MNYLDVCRKASSADAGTAQAFAKGIEAVRAGLMPVFESEYACHSPDEQRWFVGRVTRLSMGGRAYVVVTHEDISPRTLATRTPQESDEWARVILNAAQAGIVVLDADTRLIVDANDVALEMLGRPRRDVLGRHCRQFFCNAGHEIACPLADGGARVHQAELVLLKSTGEELPILKTARAEWHNGRRYLIESFLNIEPIKAAERALRESEDRFLDVLYASDDTILLIDGDAFIDCNAAAARMLGYRAKEDFLPAHPAALSPPEQPDGRNSREKADEMVRLALGRSFHRFEWTHRRATGEDFLVEVSMTPIIHRNRRLLYCHWRDITEQRHAEERRQHLEKELRTHTQLLTTIIATIPNFVFWKDRDGVYLGCNENLARVAGLSSPAEIVGKTDYDLAWTPEEADWYRRCDRDVMEHGEPLHNLEETQLQADGARAVLLTSKAPLRDLNGNVTGLLGVFTDITKQKANEEALRRSQFLLRASERLARVGGWEYDFEADRVCGTDEWMRICGVARRELTLAELLPVMHPDDRERTAQALQDARHDGRPYDLEHRIVRPSDGEVRVIQSHAEVVRDDAGRVIGLLGCAQDVTERKQEEDRRDRASKQIGLLSAALQSAAEAILITDARGTIVWVNQSFIALTGYSFEEAVGANPRILKSGVHDSAFYTQMWDTIRSGRVWSGRLRNRKKNGDVYPERMTITPVRGDGGPVSHFVAIKQDIMDEELREAEHARTQKLQSIGQLAAGIAHEINTPTQFVSDNTRFLQDAIPGVLRVVEQCAALLETASDMSSLSERAAALRGMLYDLRLDYIREEIPKAISDSIEGLERVAQIVRAMKDFSHPATTELAVADLNRAIESTTIVARNEWKYVADLELDLAPDLPPVPVRLGEFNQVILNLVVNAAHAIEEALGRSSGRKGRIRITTRGSDDAAEIRVADTGAGIRPEHRDRIFEHFFTTKAVGRGTGQGLAVARAVIEQQHGGKLTFESQVGVGTTFIICLPLHRAAEGGA